MRYLRILETKVLDDLQLVHGFCAYNNMLYGVTWDYPAKLTRINPVDLSYAVVELESDHGTDIKPAKGYLWGITYWHSGVKLYRIDPSDLSYKLFTWSGIDYPHTVIYDNANTLYIGGNSGGILKVDISDVSNPNAVIVPTGYYHHHVMVWCGSTKKLAIWGMDLPFTSWANLYNSNKFFSIYDPADGAFTHTGIEYWCTDDGTSVGDNAYFAVESVPGYPAYPREVYCLDTRTGNVTGIALDDAKVSPYADGIYYDGSKLLVSYRAVGERDGTIVALSPSLDDIEYFPTAYSGYDLAPDEIAQVGNLYFGTSEYDNTRRVFSFNFFDKACSEYTTQSECESSACFWWSDNTCHPVPEALCKDYTSQVECEANDCYWWSDKTCHANPEEPLCSSYTNPEDCYINSCYWWLGACHKMPLDCAVITDRAECVNAGCNWYGGGCHEDKPPSCTVFGNATDCEDAGCYWYNNSCHMNEPVCPDYDSQAECENAGCYWYDGSCHSTAVSYTFNLVLGSNYISMPVKPLDPDPTNIFPGCEVWTYDTATGGMIPPSVFGDLECGCGYHVRSPDNRVVEIDGTPCTVSVSDLVSVFASLGIGQLALIGPGRDELNVAGTVLEGHVEGYNSVLGKWEHTNVLSQGKAFWMSRTAAPVSFLSAPAGATLYVDGAYKGVC